jgi:hypothetical protein
MPKIIRVSTPAGTRYLVEHNGIISPPLLGLSVAYLYVWFDLGLDRWEE